MRVPYIGLQYSIFVIKCTRAENQATAKPAFGFHRDSDKITHSEAVLTGAKRVAGFWSCKKSRKPSDGEAGIWSRER